jgi:hypothetical protein
MHEEVTIYDPLWSKPLIEEVKSFRQKCSIVLHYIDPNLPRFDCVNGQWVKHDPKSTLPNPDYQTPDET